MNDKRFDNVFLCDMNDKEPLELTLKYKFDTDYEHNDENTNIKKYLLIYKDEKCKDIDSYYAFLLTKNEIHDEDFKLAVVAERLEERFIKNYIRVDVKNDEHVFKEQALFDDILSIFEMSDLDGSLYFHPSSINTAIFDMGVYFKG